MTGCAHLNRSSFASRFEVNPVIEYTVLTDGQVDRLLAVDAEECVEITAEECVEITATDATEPAELRDRGPAGERSGLVA